MIRPSGFSNNLPSFKPGDLITFIEGDSWVFITKAGEQMRTPPVGIVLSTFDEIGIRVLWSTGNITMEWRSGIQLHSEFVRKRREKEERVE